MAFPNTLILDNFNRADEMPLDQANWRDVFGMIVNTNMADRVAPGIVGYTISLYNVAFGPMCDAYVFIPVIDNSQPMSQARVYARYDIDAETGYFAQISYQGGPGLDYVQLYKHFEGFEIAISGAYPITLADGDGVGIRCDGNNISAYHYTLGAWALLGTVVDIDYPDAGLCGIHVYQSDSGGYGIPLDNFGAGNETGAAFPEPGVIDNFNRANEGPPPSASWVDLYVMGVVSNQCAARQTPTDYDIYMLWRSAFAQNQEGYVTIPTRQNDGNGISVFSRWQDRANTLEVYITRDDGGDDEVEIYQCVAGVDSSIGGPYIITYQDGDAFGVYCTGTTIEAWHKPVGGAWVLLGSGVTTLPLAAGHIGLFVHDTIIRFADFGGGDYVPAITLNLTDSVEAGEAQPFFMIGLALSDSTESQDVIGAIAQISGTLLELHDYASGYAPSRVLNLVENDSLPVLVFSLTDANGSAFDLSAATTTLRVRARDGEPGHFIINKVCDYVPISGYVQYDLQAGDLATPGEYYCDLQVDFGGRTLTSEVFLIQIREAL